jgi:hypothetical protein
MQLFYVEFKDGNGLYIKEDEYNDFSKAMILLSIEHNTSVVTEPMYAIHWFDYIDDEWSIIWCTEDSYEETMAQVLESEVEYEVETFNM